MTKLYLATMLAIPLACGTLMAQGGGLALVVKNVYGPTGLQLPNTAHNAHFDSDFEASFGPLNSSIATQLSLLPLVSPTSGFVYEFDRSLGVAVRSESQNFGSILTERGETIGRDKVLVGFAYQHFDFKTIDGLDLQNFGTVYHHVATTSAYGVDFVTSKNKINLTINQYTPFFTFGLTNRLDVSIAIPIVNVNLIIVSDATIHRLALPFSSKTGLINGEAHFFDINDTANSIRKTFTNSGTASGIGDVVIRVKGTVWKGESAALALAADIRTPSGDPRNLLGSGAIGFKPFAAFSFYKHRFAPHVNIGYERNGDSVLAGDVATAVQKHLPNQFFYAVGTSIRASKAVTVALDLLGQRVIDGQQVQTTTFSSRNSRDDPTVINFQDIRFAPSSFNITNGAVGVKFSPVNKLLVTANVLFKLNDAGLRAKAVPLVGISYAF